MKERRKEENILYFKTIHVLSFLRVILPTWVRIRTRTQPIKGKRIHVDPDLDLDPLVSQQLQKNIILCFLAHVFYLRWFPVSYVNTWSGYHEDIFCFKFSVSSWWPPRKRFLTSSFSSVADPDPGSGAFLTPGSGMEKNPEPGSRTRDLIFENLVSVFWVINTWTLWCGSGSGVRDLVNPGSGIRDGKISIRDKHSGSATLSFSRVNLELMASFQFTSLHYPGAL